MVAKVSFKKGVKKPLKSQEDCKKMKAKHDRELHNKRSRNIKFRYCEKATKFEKNIFESRYLVTSKQSGRIFQIIVGFSEYLNFGNNCLS